MQDRWAVDIPESSDLGIDWAVRARRYEHNLSASLPVFPEADVYRTPTVLEVDFHEGIEVGILLSGGEERHWGDYCYEARAGDVWLASMWEPHGWRVTHPNTWYVVLIFLPDFLGGAMLGDQSWLNVFAVPPEQRPHVTMPRQRRRILAAAQEMREEIEQRRPHWLTALQLGLVRVMLELCRDWEPRGVARDHNGTLSNKLSRIVPALELLRERGPAGVGVPEAAAACGMSRATFSTIFRQTMGLSFGRLRLRAHLAYAAHRLLTTDLATDAIAAEAGFTDASHLHRAFVKHYGCTPGHYREQSR